MAELMQKESEYVKELEKRAEKKQQEITIKQQKADVDKRVENLKNMMLEFAKEYGVEDYRTQMMISFHDMALNMKETLKTVEAFNELTLFLSDTIGFIDQSYDLMNNLFKTTNTKRYSLFRRIANWFRMRKAMRRMKVRMDILSKNMASTQKLTLIMSKSMNRAANQLRLAMAKNTEKSQKEALKKGEEVVAPEESRSLKMCKEYLQEQGNDGGSNLGGDSSSDSSSIIGPDQI